MLQEILPSDEVIIELAYASSKNFTGKSIYKEDAKCYLRQEAAIKFTRAVEQAARLGYKIKIFDAFRPLEAQKKLFSYYPDPRFVSDPEHGPAPHCRGCAIDLTLCDQNKQELDMGTKFDSFSPLSAPGASGISKEAEHNRLTLLGIMTIAGFQFHLNEWWHFQLFDSMLFAKISDGEEGDKMLPIFPN